MPRYKNFDIFENFKSLETKGSRLHSSINNNQKGKKSLKISVFGGSTTILRNSVLWEKGTWPYRLYQTINRKSQT